MSIVRREVYISTYANTLRNIMSDVVNDSRVLSLVGRQGLKGGLEVMVDQLNRCQKALNEFLEVCRHFVITILVLPSIWCRGTIILI